MTEVLPFECDYEHACRVEPDHECANTNYELNPMHEKEPQTLSNCCPYCGNLTPHANAIRNRQHSVDVSIKDAWREKKSLEQRYHQLEQVAKMMLSDFERARTLAFEGCSANALTVVSLSADSYKDELEALGVSVDD